MIPDIRAQYNAAFTAEKYQAFLAGIHQHYPGALEFRVAETPIFVGRDLRDQLIAAGEQLIDHILAPDFMAKTERAIPPGLRVPHESHHCPLLTFDFAICQDDTGRYVPQLIELQGFATLYGYQAFLADHYPRHFFHPPGYTPFFHGLDTAGYLAELRRLFIGDEDPASVILLEIYPETQKTRIDFVATRELLGIETVCLTALRKAGRTLYYEKNGHKQEIRRIYNRVIFDDLQQNYPDLRTEFHFSDDVDVTWIAHPNWFFRVSKFTLPLLHSPFVPPSYYLDALEAYPPDLENYVLKPLFSFAGTGVQLHVQAADLDAITAKANYLLQRKVTYAPVVQAPNGWVKAEVRLMYSWPAGDARPTLLTNLARMSRGEMIGVRYNKDFDWVGGNICYFEPG